MFGIDDIAVDLALYAAEGAVLGLVGNSLKSVFSQKKEMNSQVRMLKKLADMDKSNEQRPLGTSSCSVFVSTGKKPVKSMLSGNITYHDEFNVTAIQVANQVKFTSLSTLGTYNQWLSDDDTNINRDVLGYKGWFKLNPLQGIADGEFVPSATDPGNDRMMMTKAHCWFDILNVTSLPVFLTFEWFVAKQDTSETPLANCKSAYDARKTYTTSYTYPAPGVAATIGGNVEASFTNRSNTTQENLILPPYTSLVGYQKAWKSLKFKKLILSAGDVHKMSIPMVINQYMRRETLAMDVETYLKGSVICIMSQQGGAVKDTSAAGTYTLGGSSINVLINRKVHLAPCKIPNNRLRTEAVYTNFVSGSAPIANNQTVNLGTFAAATGIIL